jgi:tRNA pseudouridine32 synthase / 23S rRNA pseudouridine746 synthase
MSEKGSEMKRRYTTPPRPLPEPVDADPNMAALLQARVLYQDDHVLVINKPAGLAVHPGPRTAESLELYLPFLMLDRKKPPHPVHRLDRDTSGCLVLGRTPGSVRQLSGWFSERQVEKTYLAIIDGVPDKPSGLIDAPLLKTSSEAGGWRMIVAAQGQTARTRWRLLKSDGRLSLLELKPETGRTHQLRVHSAHAGWPILGDPVYGTARADKRMYLHASDVVLPTRDGGQLIVTAPPPDDWPLA